MKTMAVAQDLTEVLARRIGSIVDPSVRTAYLRFTLLELPPQEVAELLVVTHALAEARSSRHATLLACLSLALSDPACQALRESVARILDAQHQTDLSRSLRRNDLGDEDDSMRVPDFGLGRPVTLGERKSLARKHDRELIARVLRDPHPHVIRILLHNPSLIESDVMRLCAMRPVSAEALREVFQSARWIVRYPIKLALALNPYTPLDIALQLAPHLHDQDLQRVLEAADLPRELHDACRRRTVASVVH
jgi:hypothetical protein